MLLMDFDFEQIRSGNPNWGHILFCSYIGLSVRMAARVVFMCTLVLGYVHLRNGIVVSSVY